jgi:GR25 family glycosyltransferase involved in LPS biosynthesis
MKLNIENVYVVHYTKLTERRSVIERQFNEISKNLIFIEDFDAEVITNDIINEWYQPSEIEWEERNNKLWRRKGLPTPAFRRINMAEISCTIKHIKAMELIAQNGDGFIIEDDVLLKENFVENFNKAIDELPEDWDVIMIGAGCNMHVPSTPDKLFYKVSDPATRCLDSYLVSQSAAQKLIKTIKPFQTISDWELAWQLHLNNLTTYWLEPSLCVQGSETGVYKTTLR